MKIAINLSLFLIIGIATLLLCSCDNDTFGPNIIIPQDPNSPHDPYPSNNASGQPLAMTLSWECQNADLYHIYFGDQNPPMLQGVVDTNAYMILGLDENLAYYWQIEAVNFTSGDTIVGPVWNFSTADWSSQPGYRLIEHNISTELPCFVNIMFQATNLAGNGVADLQTSDFEVLEDAEPVSPTESAMKVKKLDQVPYSLKTVLLLDNSTSVAAVLDSIKLAALALVNTKLPQQSIAIYEFSENPVLVQDFTTDANLLTSAINSIDIGFASTNLYGAVIEGAARWYDFYSLDNITQGSMVILTDGSDTQGSHTIYEALQAIGNKMVYSVGLGDEIDPEVLQQLGTADFISVSNISDLVTEFETIQESISLYANSFYWLNYMSPKRSDNDHTLELNIPTNPHAGNDAIVSGEFNSDGFYPAIEGIYVNKSAVNLYGIDSLTIVSGSTANLKAESFLGDNWPYFEWSCDDPGIVSVVASTSDDATAYATAVGPVGSTTTIRVQDTMNSFTKEIYVEIIFQ
ncbi:VWA domain-containing protein [bacterium]|nr:VWA domain-containing protein [bacterium]MBU1652820.1 VWA domain-containing protein [bacterium]